MRLARLLFIASFLLVLGLPGLSLMLALADPDTRTAFMAQKLPWEKRLPMAMRGYQALLRSYDRGRYQLFGLLPRATLIGKDGWLYYRSDEAADAPIFSDYRGELTPNQEELKGWASILRQRQLFMDSLGVTYLAVVAPNKPTSYPFGLPDDVRLEPPPPTRLDYALPAMQGSTHLPMLDLRAPLKSPDPSQPLFFKTDSHWNDEGAYKAYSLIARALGFQALDTSGWKRDSVNFAGDIARMGFLEDQFQERTLRLRPPVPLRATYDNGDACLHPAWTDSEVNSHFPSRGIASKKSHTLSPIAQDSALIFHDSYTLFLLPYLSQHFASATWVWGHLDTALVREKRPGYVLEIRAERLWLDFF